MARREITMMALVTVDDVDDPRVLEESLAKAASAVDEWVNVVERTTVRTEDEVKP